MLRPATPLTILLFVAFVLLLISVISTPVVRSIPLGQYAGVNFGVFGYCQGSTCSKIEVGYDTSSLFTADQTNTFNLASGTRSTLSRILIVHPIAAFATLVMFVLAASAHFHAPSHSPRYLLCIFLFSIITLLISLLAFLVDVLLFVPHIAWGSYIVLAATVLIACSGVVSCAMRRTIVSKKAQRRRIEENAEMNGENFYNRQAAQAASIAPAAPPTTFQDANKLPSFATFEMAKNDGTSRTSGDERIPLTARSASHGEERGETSDGSIPLQDRYNGAPPMPNGSYNGPPPPQRDQYGNIMPPQSNNYSRGRDQSQDSQFRNPYPGQGAPYRGGGGHSGVYRGRGGPQGGYRGRGGPQYPGPGRGGYGPSPGRGGYGQGPNRGPSPPMNGMGSMGDPSRGGMATGAMMRGGRGGAPPNYQNGFAAPNTRGGPSPSGPYEAYSRPSIDGARSQTGPAYGAMPPSGDYAGFGGRELEGDTRRDSLPRAESPPPLPEEIGMVGQAVEMDATTGSPSAPPAEFMSFEAMRNNGTETSSFGNQQEIQQLARHGTIMSDSSRYSGDETYVPPRSAWAGEPRTASPLHPNTNNPGAPLVSPLTPTHARQMSADDYYEDVDPRFAPIAELPVDSHPIQTLTQNLPPIQQNGGLVGMNRNQNNSPNAYLHPQGHNQNLHPISVPTNHSFEDIHSGSRSPAESERSTFTSVSQRGINPRWNPQMGPGGFGPPLNGPPQGGMRRAPPGPSRNDVLLDSNPDFNLPGVGARGGRGGMRGGSNFPAGALVARSPYDGAAM